MPSPPLKRADIPQGSATAPATAPTDTGSDLLTTNAAGGGTIDGVPNITGSGIVSPITITTSATADSSSSSPADPAENTSGAASSSSSSSIPLGAVIGACVGSVVLLIILVSFVFWHTKRSKLARSRDMQKKRNYERRQSKRETWKELGDGGSADGHVGMDESAMKMRAYPSPSSAAPMMKDKMDLPQLSPLPFETESKEYKFTASNPPPLVKEPLPPMPEKPQFAQISHPYATAVPRHSIPLSIASDAQTDASMYSPDPHTSVFSESSTTPMIPQNLLHPYATAQSVLSPALSSSVGSPLPTRTGTTSHNHNPFFTAHPGSHDGPERWGSVGKERSVTGSGNATPKFPEPDNHSQRVGSPSLAGSATMENLIAALSLNSAGNSISVSHAGNFSDDIDPALNRSHHGHLDTFGSAASHSPIPEDEGDGDDEAHSPFHFDTVYNNEISYSPTEHHVPATPFSGYTQSSTGTDPDSTFGIISPGAFPMPPR